MRDCRGSSSARASPTPAWAGTTRSLCSRTWRKAPAIAPAALLRPKPDRCKPGGGLEEGGDDFGLEELLAGGVVGEFGEVHDGVGHPELAHGREILDDLLRGADAGAGRVLGHR